jgi:hypothetical protein
VLSISAGPGQDSTTRRRPAVNPILLPPAGAIDDMKISGINSEKGFTKRATAVGIRMVVPETRPRSRHGQMRGSRDAVETSHVMTNSLPPPTSPTPPKMIT